MEYTFYKYQGTGNDFIIIDNRQHIFPKNNTKLVATLCNRKFGIGADGLILLENDETADFKMVYYNADGNQSSMCGNGGRCIVAFAHKLGIVEESTVFSAVDGLHEATIKNNTVSLKMQDVLEVAVKDDYVFLDTGSPHHVAMVSNLKEFDVFTSGKAIRYNMYGKEGSNVNFVEAIEDGFVVRTYERGVENETLSCGTGVTAVALAMHATKQTTSNTVALATQGGNLQVAFASNGKGYKDIYLMGPATFVFKGTICVNT
jgi:diaminopimelate epimerase